MIILFLKIKEVIEFAVILGYEVFVCVYFCEKLILYVDEVVIDGLGGIFGIKYLEAVDVLCVLVVFYMDEVGFMVSEIKLDGIFCVVEIGGWNFMVVSS